MTLDPWIYRVVVVFLGVTLLASLAAAFFLVLEDKQVPDFFIATGSGALAALGALLVPSPLSRQPG